MTTDQLTPLEETLQQLMNDLEVDPSFNPQKVADIKRATEALIGMVKGGSNTSDAVHSLIFTVARLVIMSVPASEEIVRRENYCRMLFDYMTDAMTTPVCAECGYDHDESEDCEAVELDLEDTEPQYYQPASTHLH